MLAALAALVSAGTAGAQEVELELESGETLLQIEARGEHLARPDVMSVRAGVVTTGRTAAEAMEANNRLAQRLIDRVRALGIEPRDVQTEGLSLQPRFNQGEQRSAEQDGRPPRILGYVASNSLRLRLRDLARAGDIIPALLDAGANSVSGPVFSLSQPRPAAAAAQREAVRLAREEADNIAEAMNMRVARVLRVSEREADSGPGDRIIVTGSRIPRTPIEPGEIVTESTMWVDFALAPR